MPSKEARAHLFTLRVNSDERDRMSEVAGHYGLTVAATIRMLLKQEHAFIAAEPGKRSGGSSE